MRGEKTITFDRPFEYSEGGEWREATTVTVRAPGLGKFQIHTNMMRYVSAALLTFTERMAGKRAEIEDDEAPEKEDEQDALFFLSMGLGEDFPKFADFVKKSLTDSKLAYIDDPKNRITDAVWDSIEETNGMEAVMEIMSEFSGFFMDAMASKSAKETGKKESATSVSATKARSNTKK